MQKNKKNICILGGNDDLTNSFYLYCKKKFHRTIYINFSGKKLTKDLDKNIFNLHLYELKKCLNILEKNDIDKIVLLGKISRPDLSKFKFDGIIDQYLDKLINAYKKGDGKILDIVISIFNEKGFKIVPITQITSNFSFSKNIKNRIFNKIDSDQGDINKALKILDDLSKYDNAQSIVLDNGFILAIEAAEGTDEMLDKVYRYKQKLGLKKGSSGILVKLPKKSQSLKVDLPVIGPRTIKLLKKSNINSLAVSKKNTLVKDLDKTLIEIDKNKINLYFI
tara:strand:- start:960 stop:1796 length:837 start_codon:yes stop_codon:yes gene_type:complete